jgi:hypothetical protein
LSVVVITGSPEPQNHPHPGPRYQAFHFTLWLTSPRQEEHFLDFCVYNSWGPFYPNSLWCNGTFLPLHQGKLMFGLCVLPVLEFCLRPFPGLYSVFPIEDKGPQLCSSHQGPKSSMLSSFSSL